jgi:endonuclease/exonuclease/phosphatase family metal-dependent hydrolase
VGALSAELPDNYAKFEAAGWVNSNTDADEPLCTWCPSNLITRGSANEAIDHVFVKDADADHPTRLLGEPITVSSEDGAEITTSYSDHFGVSVRVTLP